MYLGFKKLESKIAAGGARNPGAVAAAIGRRKYGAKKFNKAAASGHSLKGAKPVGKWDVVNKMHHGGMPKEDHYKGSKKSPAK